LGQAIDSALSQTGDVTCEVLVMDDGSTDGTSTLVHSYADPRVRYERNETNAGYAGVSRNGNRCLEYARGAYITILAGTPHLTPGRRSALNRRRYGEIAKGEWIEALHALRRHDIRRSARALRSGWHWQFAKAGWWSLPQTLGDALELWRKRRQGRSQFVSDVP
jgi:glycosyltransferase involved in cell wall biosynthesis